MLVARELGERPLNDRDIPLGRNARGGLWRLPNQLISESRFYPRRVTSLTLSLYLLLGLLAAD